MDPRLQRRVQRYGWDRAAPTYERHWARQLIPAQRLLLETAALRPGERVLDVACGTGLVTFPAAEAVGEDGSVLATDLSEEMVRRIRDAAEARRVAPVVSSERMGAESLDVEDASFDAVLCSLGLMYVPDPPAALGEARRSLRPGGRCVAAVWGARKACGWAEIFPIVDARVNTEVCPLFFHLGTGDTLADAFRAADFEHVGSERISSTLDFESDEDALGAAFAAGPVAMAYSRFDDETRAEVHAEYLESISRFRVGDGYRIPGEFVVVKGVRG